MVTLERVWGEMGGLCDGFMACRSQTSPCPPTLERVRGEMGGFVMVLWFAGPKHHLVPTSPRSCLLAIGKR